MIQGEFLAPTIDADQATGKLWDVLVIGAGPAGAIAARQCARRGASVLLVDRSRFPRGKVCGCCLNGAALGVLQQIGLGELTRRCGAFPIDQFRLASRHRFADVPIKAGVALSRERLDAELVAAAIESGVEFLEQTQAMVGETDGSVRRMVLKNSAVQTEATARMVVVAGGLGNRVFIDGRCEQRQTERRSRVGAGTSLTSFPEDYRPGTIYMACHRDGYVGMVCLEDGRLDIAAAFDSEAIKRHDGVGSLAENVIRHAGLQVPDHLDQAKWQGTARLTQHRQQLFGDRYLVVGDAAGYVEPFTGEGMAWAFASGMASAPLVIESLQSGTSISGPRWAARRKELLGGRMRLCRTVSRLLRYPRLVSAAAWGLSHAPRLASPVVTSLNKSFELCESSQP